MINGFYALNLCFATFFDFLLCLKNYEDIIDALNSQVGQYFLWHKLWKNLKENRKIQKNTEKYRKIQKKTEKCRKMQKIQKYRNAEIQKYRNTEKYRKIQKNTEIHIDLFSFIPFCNQTAYRTYKGCRASLISQIHQM